MNPVFKRTVTGLAIGAAVICAILFAPPCAIVSVVAILILLAFAEFFLLMTRKRPEADALQGICLLVGGAVIACGLLALLEIALRYGNMMLLYVVAIVKFSDVGGFAVGLSSAKLMKGGNHKMCPAISPGKSWEGLLGSLLFSSLTSCCFMCVTGFGVGRSVLLGVVAALAGTAGDLVESKFKRWVGVKDSSAMRLTNGMGGFLDMLDSLLFAPAILLALLP